MAGRLTFRRQKHLAARFAQVFRARDFLYLALPLLFEKLGAHGILGLGGLRTYRRIDL